MRENPNTGFCAHSHYVRIRNTTSAFIPCNDHNFISPVAVQLKPILRFALLSQILSVPFCILIWYGFCFSKMNCISSYRAVGLWGISPWKSCKTAFRFGWKFHNFRYIWKAKKKKKGHIAYHAIHPLLISPFRELIQGVGELVERRGLV